MSDKKKKKKIQTRPKVATQNTCHNLIIRTYVFIFKKL